MILPILTYPNEILRQKANEIENPTDPVIREFIFDMLETLEHNKGVGLAAPQVGRLIRLCVIKLENKTYILINPKIKSKSFSKDIMEEGCLSLPGKYMPVRRHKKVKVEALDRKGNKIIIEGKDMLARAIQHEIDHLDGILIIDKIEKNVKVQS